MSTPSRKKTTVVAFTLAALVMLSSGCTTETAKNPTSHVDADVVKVGVIPTATTATVYVAQDKGYFEAEGLKVEMQVIQNAASVAPSVLNGQLQFGTAATPPFLSAVAKNLPLTAIANGANVRDSAETDDSALLVGKDSSVTRPKDLEGKTVGVNALSAMMHITAAAAIKADGGDPDKVTFVAMSFPDMVSSLKRGAVDAVSILEPFYSQSLQEGSKVIGHPFTGSLKRNGTSALFFASESYAGKNPEIVVKFSRALDKASVAVTEDPSLVKDVLKKYGGMSDAALQNIKLPGYSSAIDIEALEKMQSIMEENGFLEEGVLTARDAVWKP